jgi:hypothetical protein
MYGDLPETVFKYRNWNDGEDNCHNTIITEKKIWMASPESFGADYNECRLPYDFESVTEEHIKRWKELNDEDIDNYLTRKVMNENYGISGVRLKHMVAQLKDDHLFFDQKNRSDFIQYDRQVTAETLGVFCTSYDVSLVSTWTEVGNLGTSYAVEFRTSKLQALLKGSVQVVQYYDRRNPPKLFPLTFSVRDRVNKALREIGSIPNDCHREREVRFSKTALAWPLDRSVILSDDCYKAIYLGPECRDKDEITKARNGFLSDLPIYITEYREDKVVCTEQI